MVTESVTKQNLTAKRTELILSGWEVQQYNHMTGNNYQVVALCRGIFQ